MTEAKPSGMLSYHFETSPDGGITYGDMTFKSFLVREVYVNGKQKGEFHIKPLESKAAAAAVLFLKPRFPTCSIGLADPSGLLSLEYPIYLICKNDPMVMDAIPQLFDQIDEEMDAG